MNRKVAIVTGASSGVGLETARGLAAADYRVVLAVRDAARGEQARRDIERSSPQVVELEVRLLDLADCGSVRRFSEAFLETHDRLDLLVNNAGIHTAQRQVTRDGHELTLQTNHLGHFLLTLDLLPLLRRSAPSRIVNVASEAHRGGGLDLDDLMFERRRWSGLFAYTQSKLANLLFTFALARRLEGTGVTVNAVHPGSVRTGWARGSGSGLFRHVVALASPFLISPEQGARTSLHVATAPDLERVTGQYFVRSKRAKPSRLARDVTTQERLWTESERLTGARYRETD